MTSQKKDSNYFIFGIISKHFTIICNIGIFLTMTIKIRNRITTIFFIISSIYLLVATAVTLYQVFTKTLTFPQFYLTNIPKQFLFTNNSTAVIILLFFSIAYICSTTFIIKQNFEKTQATDMLFFLMFLFAFQCDTVRLFVPLFNCAQTYSNFLIAIANVTLFGRILAPLSIFATIILSSEDFRQSVNQNLMIILITSLFFAMLIPINTAIIMPNFTISFAYVKLLRTFTIIIFLISIFSLFYNNYKNDYSQYSTIGLTLICTGYLIATNGYSIITTILASLFLMSGTHFYMSTIHRQYLWNI